MSALLLLALLAASPSNPVANEAPPALALSTHSVNVAGGYSNLALDLQAGYSYSPNSRFRLEVQGALGVYGRTLTLMAKFGGRSRRDSLMAGAGLGLWHRPYKAPGLFVAGAERATLGIVRLQVLGWEHYFARHFATALTFGANINTRGTEKGTPQVCTDVFACSAGMRTFSMVTPDVHLGLAF